MSENNIPEEAASTDDIVEAPMDEMTLLRARAAQLGIQVAPNIKPDTLRKRIEARLTGEPAEPEEEEVAAAPMTRAQATHTLMESTSDHARKLVRCTIICNDPGRKDLKGEVFCVSNRYFGTIRRLVPYSRHAAESWHVEHALLRMLQRKKFYRVNQEIDKATGRTVDRSELVPLFTISLLEPLTEKELANLASAQAAQAN